MVTDTLGTLSRTTILINSYIPETPMDEIGGVIEISVEKNAEIDQNAELAES